jgi:PRC-barrel domain protein
MREKSVAPVEETDAETAAPGSAVSSLARLRGYRVAPGDPDVRGWQVYAGDGGIIGQVDDLLVDTAAMKVRYLQVRLDRALQEALGGIAGSAAVPGMTAGEPPGILAGGSLREHLVRETLSDLENRLTADHRLGGYHYAGERHILLPIGRASLDSETDRIVIGSLTAEDAFHLPVYTPGSLDREFEECLRRSLDGSWRREAERDFYAHDFYDEARFYRSRRSRTDTAPPHRGQ